MATPWQCPFCGAERALPAARTVRCPACGRSVELEGPSVAGAPPRPVVPVPEGETCLFCERETSRPGVAIRVLLVQGRGKAAPRRVLEVPRCERCLAVHLRRVLVMKVSGAVAAAALIGAGLAFGGSRAIFWASLGLVVGTIAGIALGRVLARALAPPDVKPERAKYGHPRVRDLVGEGWKVIEDDV